MQLRLVTSIVVYTLTFMGLLEGELGVRTAIIPRASASDASSLDAKEHRLGKPPPSLPPDSRTFLSLEFLSESNHSLSLLHSLYNSQNPPLFIANLILLSSPNFSFVNRHKTRHFNITPIGILFSSKKKKKTLLLSV